MNGGERALTTEQVTDFVTALPVEDCARLLRHGARQAYRHRLAVRLDGEKLSLILISGPLPRGQNPLLWLLRFEGDLTPVSTGTRVQGVIIHNKQLESALIAPGVITGLCGGVGIALEITFVSILAGILLALSAGYYFYWRRLTQQQGSELLHWLYESLMLPQGWAGGSV
ncbi:MAG: hypothetical protein HY866_07830 [Chloroflexi bacterium]|nr:hypothetical protein [Chloroflexota bacterium]